MARDVMWMVWSESKAMYASGRDAISRLPRVISPEGLPQLAPSSKSSPAPTPLPLHSLPLVANMEARLSPTSPSSSSTLHADYSSPSKKRAFDSESRATIDLLSAEVQLEKDRHFLLEKRAAATRDKLLKLQRVLQLHKQANAAALFASMNDREIALMKEQNDALSKAVDAAKQSGK